MNTSRSRWMLAALNNAPVLLFVVVFAAFGLLSPKFFQAQNLLNILVQSSSTAIVAAGMTFVLLTAGVDLSVGAIMFVGGAIAGKMLLAGTPVALALGAFLLLGLLYGSVNALCIVRLRLMPFVVTLATLYLGRGFGLWFTETRAMNLPDHFTHWGSASVAGLPLPVWVMAFVLGAAHLALTRTPFGRQIYAVGQDADAARKAGIATGRILAAVYAICGLCAALGGAVSLAQLGCVAPTFGNQREFSAIAAAVLGGTSLFGGRGNVLPGTLIGAVLIQTVETGLNIINANPYLYPLITSGIIFLAVLIDSARHAAITRLGRRCIRPAEA